MQSYADGNFLIANKLYCQGTLAPTKKLLLLLLNRFSRVQLCATPQTAAQQALPSLGFSYKQPYADKMDNLEETDKFLEKYSLSRLNQEDIFRGYEQTNPKE